MNRTILSAFRSPALLAGIAPWLLVLVAYVAALSVSGVA